MTILQGKLGRTGVQWFGELKQECEKHPQLLTEWQQQFLDSVATRVEYYGEDAHLSEKQANIITEIAEKVGML